MSLEDRKHALQLQLLQHTGHASATSLSFNLERVLWNLIFGGFLLRFSLSAAFLSLRLK